MKSLKDILSSIENEINDVESETINEVAVHPELQKILDDDVNNKWNQKLTRVSKKLRDLTSRGESTGIQDDKPKKGSSRAVFFPNHPKQVDVDGNVVPAQTAVKIAFKGWADPHTESDKLLGEHQNEIEGDHYLHKQYSVLQPIGEGKYKTNEHGVLPPLYDSHPDSHWIEHGFARNMTKKDFKEATRDKNNPKGLDFDSVQKHLENEHSLAHGMREKWNIDEETNNKISEHPLVDSLRNAMLDGGLHPGDNRLQNWGMWKHPVTGKEHPVLRDFGFSNEIAKLYGKARRGRADKKGY